MGELGVIQYDIVVNVFSLTIAAMGVAAAFFLMQRNEVLPRYKMGLTLLGLVAGVSAYFYYRLYGSWTEAFGVMNGTLRSSGTAFNEGLRYAEWLLTAPLLLVAFVRVLDMPAQQARLRSTVLGVLAVEMIILRYPGQLSSAAEGRWLWWGVALVPAIIIVYQLYVGLASAINTEPVESRNLARKARLLLVLTGAAYPVLYLFPLVGVTGGIAYTGMQAGYAVADILSKVAFGLLLFRMAAIKSVPVEEMPVLAGTLRAVKG